MLFTFLHDPQSVELSDFRVIISGAPHFMCSTRMIKTHRCNLQLSSSVKLRLSLVFSSLTSPPMLQIFFCVLWCCREGKLSPTLRASIKRFQVTGSLLGQLQTVACTKPSASLKAMQILLMQVGLLVATADKGLLIQYILCLAC